MRGGKRVKNVSLCLVVVPDYKRLVLMSILGGTAIALSLLRVEVPFPLLPYLKFDAAEIPDALAFYFCGLPYGLAATLIHFLGLVARGSDPVSASMKLGAVAAMLLGAAAARRLVWQVVWGSTVRAVVMTIANYLYLYVLFPGFLGYALSMVSWLGGAAALFALTAVFNVLHTVLTLVIARWIFEEVKKRLGGSLVI